MTRYTEPCTSPGSSIIFNDLRRSKQFGTFSFVTGLVTVIGIFGLVRAGSEITVVVTFLIVGVGLIVTGLTLLIFSSRILRRQGNEDRERLGELGGNSEKPPSYETVVKAQADYLPCYLEAVNMENGKGASTEKPV